MYYGIVATLTNGIIMVIRSVLDKKLPFNGTNASTYCMILLAGLLNVVGFNLMTIANQKANTATVSVLAYIGLVYSFIADNFVFGIQITPIYLLGVLIILFFSIYSGIHRMELSDATSMEFDRQSKKSETDSDLIKAAI